MRFDESYCDSCHALAPVCPPGSCTRDLASSWQSESRTPILQGLPLTVLAVTHYVKTTHKRRFVLIWVLWGLKVEKAYSMKVSQRPFCAGECPVSSPYEYWRCFVPNCYHTKVISLLCPVLSYRTMCRRSEYSKIFWLWHCNSIFECRINIAMWEHWDFS